jgi:hypothetical protein
MSGHDHKKKDGVRSEKKAAARKRDFQQPVLGSVTTQGAQDTSNLTDGNLAGPDWKRKDHSERG